MGGLDVFSIVNQQAASLEWVYEAEFSVRTERALAAAWLERFDDRIERLLGSVHQRWDRADIAGLHFASLYLPTRLFDDASDALAASVRYVHHRSEAALWTAAARGSPGDLSSAERALVQFAFGPRRPPLDGVLHESWSAGVAEVAKTLLLEWRGQPTLPFWPALSAHYLAFFVDFFFAGPRPQPATEVPDWLDPLLASGNDGLHDAHRVLSNWFSVPTIFRNDSSHPRQPVAPTRRKHRQPPQVLRPGRPPRLSLELLFLGSKSEDLPV